MHSSYDPLKPSSMFLVFWLPRPVDGLATGAGRCPAPSYPAFGLRMLLARNEECSPSGVDLFRCKAGHRHGDAECIGARLLDVVAWPVRRRLASAALFVAIVQR